MKKKILKVVAIFCAVNLLYQVWFPTLVWALTSGPSQPEVQTFSPVGTTDMVDLFTGDFSYSIPLLDVGGYPITLGYQSGVTMDEEASWVGLGWNINPGSITRNMRGLPDDFRGDTITKSYNIKESYSAGVTGGLSLEIVGQEALKNFTSDLNLSAGISYNNYAGIGINYGVSPTASINLNSKTNLTTGLGFNFSSQEGSSFTPSVGLSSKQDKERQGEFQMSSLGTSINSRYGMRELQFSASFVKNFENISRTIGYGGQTSISFANNTYTPSLTLPLRNYAFSFKANLGIAIYATEPNTSGSGYYSQQKLVNHRQKANAYGYLYSEAGNNNPKGLLDFNREKDGPFHETSSNLAIPNFTFDQYMVSGEGVGGSFRPYRGDIGVLRDPLVTNESYSGDGGIELGPGGIIHNGLDLSFTDAISTSGDWSNDETVSASFVFHPPAHNSLFENVYFKAAGEKTLSDQSYLDALGSTSPIANSLSRQGTVVTTSNKFNRYISPSSGAQSITLPYDATKQSRDKRTQLFSHLTANEASSYGLDRKIKSYPINTIIYGQCNSPSVVTIIDRIFAPVRKYPHLSELTVTNTDGKRYVYGVPVYNNFQKEVTFSIDATGNRTTGLASYTPGTENSIGNNKGRDHYYSSDSIPSYAHSFLLSGILSPDYVDMNGDGITDDDAGEAIKFNYSRYATDYKWRMPFNANKGNYHEGLLATDEDDKASYIYGQKELWYTHSIESKTFVAQFILEDRDDALGVDDEDGGKNEEQKQQRLKEIKLYSKADLIKNGSEATPIKTVHFKYSYELCPGVPNQLDTDSGKLTLKEVYFTYGNNIRGRLTGYKFTYNDGNSDYHKSYHIKNYDRWGNYKRNADFTSPISGIYNVDFPYTLQDTVLADEYSKAWSLTQIQLPSGGLIKINYESDDYAFVQHERAMQMFIIKGFGKLKSDTPNDILYDLVSNHNYIFIDVPNEPAKIVTSDDDVEKKYMSGIDTLYFKCLVNLNATKSDYVPGYAFVDSFGRVSNTRFWIKLREVDAPGTSLAKANPVTLASLQLMRLELPELAYPLSYNNGYPWNLIPALLSSIVQIADLFGGFFSRALLSGYGKTVETEQSFVRLNNPIYKKLGGGSRVQQISLDDQWSTMDAAEDKYEYGQVYEYTTQKQIDGVLKTISSGVAAYEPLIGGDEIAQRKPIYTDEKVLLAPGNRYYIETPLGESFYPGPSVGYSEVTVKNLPRDNVSRTATGKTVHQFYTAYDFPTLSHSTPLIPERVKPNPLLKLFKIGTKDNFTASQGYVVEVNDMHGKQKGMIVYDENGQEISKDEYFYFTENENAQIKHLSNEVTVLGIDGSTTQSIIGQDVDTWQDMREQNTMATTMTNQGNIDLFIALLVPIPLPSLFPATSTDQTRFRSAVTMKYVEQYGILKKVRKTVNGSSVETENLQFDGETGQPLLTKTTNEFDDPLYSFTFPAGWSYEAMAGAYENAGTILKDVTVNDGVVTGLPVSVETLLYPGDEIMLYGSILYYFNPKKLWVIKPSSTLILIDQYGKTFDSDSGLVNMKVLRSGRRNMPSVPIGMVVAATNPMTNIISNTALNDVYEANAMELSENWKTKCNNILTSECTDTFMNGCLKDFLVAFFLSPNDGLYYSTPSDEKIVEDLDCFSPCDSALVPYVDSLAPFYATVPDPGGIPVTFYQAKFGDCLLTINSLTGEAFNVKDLRVCTDFKYANGCLDVCLTSNTDFRGRACFNCVACETYCTTFSQGDTINPYKHGLLGNFRSKKDYIFYSDRDPAVATASTNIEVDGAIDSFYSFWKYNTSTGKWESDLTHSQWVRNSEVTL